MANNIKYTHDEYTAMIKDKNLIPVELYNGMHFNILHKCTVCGHEWKVKPGAIRNGHGCPQCYRRSVSKPLDVVKCQLSSVGWKFVNESLYLMSSKSPSLEKFLFEHSCGNVVESNLDRILHKSRRCLHCEPRVLKNIWSKPVKLNGRHYYSNIEKDCCEYVISIYGIDDVVLHKKYSIKSKKECDIYIKSKDLYIEVSTINKDWYLERIYKKRQLVKNFLFVSSLEQLKLFC